MLTRIEPCGILPHLANHPLFPSLTANFTLERSEIEEAFAAYPLLKRILLDKEDKSFVAKEPSRHVLYRLLAQATPLSVGSALKWQLAAHCTATEGSDVLSDIEKALAHAADDSSVPRNQLPVCGGELSERCVIVTCTRRFFAVL